MRKLRSTFLISCLLAAALTLTLAACGSEEPTPTPEPPAPTNTPIPTDTPEPTSTPTPLPTDTPEPTATPNPTADFVELDNAEGGFSIRYPAEWFTSNLGDFTVLASAEELLDSPDPGEEGGVFVIVTGDAGEIGITDPLADFDTIITEFDITDDAEVVDGPNGIIINDQTAAAAVIRGTSDNDVPIVAYFASVLNGNRVAILIGVTPAETESDFMPVFEAIASTIAVREPEVAEGGALAGLPPSEGFLLYGDTVNGVIAAAELSVWEFLGIEGEVIDVTVRPTDTDLDVVVDILDESGTSLLGGELDASFDVEEVRDLAIEASGTFYVVLRGFADTVGGYELTIAEAGAAGTTFPSAGSLAYGDTVNGSVVDEAPSRWTFEGEAGDVIAINVSPTEDDFDVVVDVLDASGASILPGGELDESFGAEEIRGLSLPSSGVFSIAIRGFAGDVGSYRLRLTEAGVLGGEGQIVYGETVEGSVVSTDPSSWGFFGEEGDYVDITAAPSGDFDLVVDVVDANGISILADGPIDVSFDVEHIRVLRLPSTGAYQILVTGYEGDLGDYELTLDLSNGGLPGSIVFASDSLEEAGEMHAFPFTAPAGEIVTIQADPDGDLDLVIDVYNEDTDELLDTVDSSTGFEEVAFEVAELGNYYFELRACEGSEDCGGDTGSYQVTLLGSDAVIFELAIGDEVVGRLGDIGYIDYIFSGIAGDVLEISAESGDDIDLVIEITDADDNVLDQVDDNASGSPEVLVYSVTEDGIYFIRVSDFFEGAGEYHLFVESG